MKNRNTAKTKIEILYFSNRNTATRDKYFRFSYDFLVKNGANLLIFRSGEGFLCVFSITEEDSFQVFNQGGLNPTTLAQIAPKNN